MGNLLSFCSGKRACRVEPLVLEKKEEIVDEGMLKIETGANMFLASSLVKSDINVDRTVKANPVDQTGEISSMDYEKNIFTDIASIDKEILEKEDEEVNSKKKEKPRRRKLGVLKIIYSFVYSFSIYSCTLQENNET